MGGRGWSIGVALFAASLLVACAEDAPRTETTTVATAQANAPASPTVQVNRVTYTCADGKAFDVTYYVGQERAVLVLDGKTIELKQERSGSGVAYGDGTITLRSQGTNAFIQQGGQTTIRDCKGQQL